MNPHYAYRRNAQSGWTRIEMLLAIYEATIKSLESGIAAVDAGDQRALNKQYLKTSQLLVLIIDGIDSESGEVAERVRALCTYAISQVGSLSRDGWRNALVVISTLHEGFEGIREEAIELETQGAIPSLSEATTRTVLFG